MLFLSTFYWFARSPNEDYDNFVKFVTTTMQALGGSCHRSAVYNFLSCYWKRLTDVLLSPSHSGLPRCLRQNEKNMIMSFLLLELKNDLISHWFLGWYVLYIYMYIHQTWHGIDMSFPPVPFGTTLKGATTSTPQGSSPYDPEIRSTLDGIKGFRRSSGKGGKSWGENMAMAMENPTRISNMGVSKN